MCENTSYIKLFKTYIMLRKMFLPLLFALLFVSRIVAQPPCIPNLPFGLTGFFPFKGNAHDASLSAINGAGYNLTPTTGRDGVANSAFHFNGNSSWIDCGTDNRGVTSEVTVCAWVKTTETTYGQWVLGKYRYEEDKGYALSIGNGLNQYVGQVGFGGRDGTSGIGNPGYQSGWSTKKVNDGAWHCLVGMAANQSWDVYVDGTLENSTPGSTLDMSTSLDVPFTIGFQIPASPVWMNGDIDNVRVYNRALSPCEIDSVCSMAPCDAHLESGLTGHFPLNGNTNDVSSSLLNGTGYALTSSNGFDNTPNGAYKLDGSSSWIDCGTDNRGVTNQVAVTAWVKTTEATHGMWVLGKYRYEEDKGYALSIGNGLDQYVGQVGFGGRDGTSGIGNAGYSSGWSSRTVNDGEWHCLVGMAANQSWEIYVDGTLESSAPGGTLDLSTSLSVPLTIGFQIPASPVWMNGDIDDVRIYNRELTPCEIDSLCAQRPIVSVKNSLSQTTDLRVYPNPADDHFDISWENEAPQNLRLTDLFGRNIRLLDVFPNAGHLEVQLEGLPPGNYFLVWHDDKGAMHSRAFVKI